MIGMSACLGGIACRYDGKSQGNEELIKLVQEKKIEIVCPELLAGLPIPRNPAEIVGGDGYDVLLKKAKVRENDGTDVTEIYLNGAIKAYEILRAKGISILILKENSPTCGSNMIYDGSFSGIKIKGVGVATAYFRNKGMKVYSENEIDLLRRDFPNVL